MVFPVFLFFFLLFLFLFLLFLFFSLFLSFFLYFYSYVFFSFFSPLYFPLSIILLNHFAMPPYCFLVSVLFLLLYLLPTLCPYSTPITATTCSHSPSLWQHQPGADIIMQLDDVVSSVTADSERFIEATYRSVRWLDRCIIAHKRPTEQNLFGAHSSYLLAICSSVFHCNALYCI